jgi:hypothetical protein
MHILFVLWDTTFIIVVLLWDFVVMCKMNIIFAENLFSTCHYHGPMAIAKLKGLRLTPIGLPNGIAILATRRERGGVATMATLADLPFCWDQWSCDTCSCADSKTQMATEVSYVVRVTKKVGNAAILAPVTKGPFGNKNGNYHWSQPYYQVPMLMAK